MNGKTARLLNKYASHSGTSDKELKSQWNLMNQHERAAEKRKIFEAMKTKKTGE
jgi:hypothetical protein